MGRLKTFLEPLRAQPQLAMMTVLIAFVMSGNGLVAPVLSVYATMFAASSMLVGLAVTLFGVGRLLANLPAGLLSERIGRKPLLCLGPAVIVVGAIGAALAHDFTSLLVWRFVQGIGSGIYMTCSSAVLVDLTTAGSRGKVMALYQGGMLLGTSMGPALGGFLAEHLGFSAPFWGYAAVCSVAFLLALSSRETSVRAARGTARPSFVDATGALLRNPLFLAVCVMNFGVFFTRTASQWLMIPLLAHDVYAMRLDTLGLTFALSAAANFMMLPLTGILIDRYGARNVAVWSSVLTGAGLILIGAGGAVAALWAGMAVLGAANGLNGPATAAYAADIMPHGLFGPAMGLLRTFGDMGFLVGPLVVGVLGDLGAFGYAGGILFNAALMLAAAGVFGLIRRGRERPLPHPAE